MSPLWFKGSVATVCAYEVVSILAQRTPTVSTLCHRWPVLTPVILGGLTIHLWPRRAA